METRQFDGALTVREDGEERIIEGLAVPYGIPADIGGIREVFAPGSVDTTSVVGRPFLYRHADPIGVIKAARETDDGLVIAARIATTTLGDDFLTLAREGAIRGLSVGFDPIEDEHDRENNTITRIKADVREVSGAVFPVHPTAAISAVRENPEGATVSDTTTAPTTAPVDGTAITELREQVDSVLTRVNDISANMQVRDQLPWSTEHDFWTAYVREGIFGTAEQRERFAQQTRDLVDLETSDAAGFTSATRWTDDILRLVNNGRRTAEAIGIQALASEGLTVDYIEQTAGVTTGNQANQLDEVTSGQYTSEPKQAPVFVEAGGNRVSRRLLDRSSPDFLTELMRDYARAYGVRWNSRVVTLLNTASATAVLDADSASEPTTTQLGKFLAEIATDMVAGCGGDVDGIVLAPDFFFTVAAVSGNGYPVAGGNVGNAGLRDYTFSAFGLTFTRDNALSAGTGFAFNRASIGLKESPGAPFSLRTTDAATLAENVAVYGYGATYLRDSGGVVKLSLDTTP